MPRAMRRSAFYGQQERGPGVVRAPADGGSSEPCASLQGAQRFICRVGCIHCHHDAVRNRTQPGELALGQLARGRRSRVAQPFQAVFLQRLPGLPVAHAAHGRHRCLKIAPLTQVLALPATGRWPACDPALPDAGVQPGSRGRLQRHHGPRAPIRCMGGAKAVPLRQRTSAELKHLQRPLDALRVGGAPGVRLWRVHAGQFGVQAGQPRAAARSSRAWRTLASVAGISCRPSRSALKYSMVPPTSSGRRPRAHGSRRPGAWRRSRSAPPSKPVKGR
jgi:hypothetical protein